MLSTQLPKNELARLAALRRYEILDTSAEVEFDDLTRLASQICATPMAFISLIDAERQWFKSTVGLEISETPRAVSFCDHAIQERHIFEVPNALEDERFRDHPLVTGAPNVRFYAGAPLVTPDGHTIGVLCVNDRVPRRLTPEQRAALAALGRQVVRQMEARLAASREQQMYEALSRRAAFQQSLLEGAACAIVSTTPKGVITSINPCAERLFGYTAAELVGKQSFCIFHDSTEVSARAAELSRQLVRRIEPDFEVFITRARQGECETREWSLVRKDGSRVPALLSMTAMRDNKAALIGYIGITRDLTERKQAEAQRERFFNLSLDMLCIAGMDGYYKRLNPAFTQTLGYATDELLAQPYLEFVHPDDRAATIADAQKLSRGVPTLQFENRLRCKDGTWRWLSWKVQPFPAEGLLFSAARDITQRKEVEAALRFAHDELENRVRERTVELVTSNQELHREIIERKAAEESLRKADEKYRNIFENVVEGIFQTTSDGDYITANPALARMYGYATPDELTVEIPKFACQLYVNPRRREEFKEALEKNDAVFGFESQVYRKDRSIIWISENARAVRDEHGKLLFYEGTTENITARKQAEESRFKLEEQLRQTQKMDAIGQLAGGVAHDFNNQLNAIMGYADLLKTSVEPAKLQRYAENICSATRRSADLTKKLLAFARKGQYQATPVNVHKLIVETIEMLERTIDKRIVLKQTFSARHDMVTGDPSQLQNALLNLAVNARDAMAAGGKLTFETENVELGNDFHAWHNGEIPAGNYIQISISDTGCGMSDDVKAHLFEPFFTTKPVGKGTGLGLASVYGTVKNHKGTINVYSESGHGTTFKIYLPIAEPPKPKPQSQADKVRESALIKTVSSLRVLLVEDEEILRIMFGDMLCSCGIHYIAAENGRQAVEIYQEHWEKIDLVILDMIMPEMDGTDAFMAMKKINPKVKVLLSTGFSLNSEVQAVLDEGVAGFIQKPFTKRELIEKAIDTMQ